MAGAVRTVDREEPMSSDATPSVTSMPEAHQARTRRAPTPREISLNDMLALEVSVLKAGYAPDTY
jgi:hypothetical protein